MPATEVYAGQRREDVLSIANRAVSDHCIVRVERLQMPGDARRSAACTSPDRVDAGRRKIHASRTDRFAPYPSATTASYRNRQALPRSASSAWYDSLRGNRTRMNSNARRLTPRPTRVRSPFGYSKPAAHTKDMHRTAISCVSGNMCRAPSATAFGNTVSRLPPDIPGRTACQNRDVLCHG